MGSNCYLCNNNQGLDVARGTGWLWRLRRESALSTDPWRLVDACRIRIAHSVTYALVGRHIESMMQPARVTTTGEKSMATVNINGISFYYHEADSVEPLLLIPGTAFTADVWDKVFDAFARDYRTIAYDRRAYQRSQGSPPP